MKLILILIAAGFTTAIPLQALAGQQEQHGVPPGLFKQGKLPPGHVKRHSQEELPLDVTITDGQMTNVVILPVPTRPVSVVDDKRVESPRGAEALPLSTPITAPPAPPPPQPAPEPPTAKQERELDAELLGVIVSQTNPNLRNATLKRMASETGTTAATLEAQMSANPKLRGGDLLMGNTIAKLSNRSADEVFAAYGQTRLWLATGRSFGVAAETLQETARRFVASGR